MGDASDSQRKEATHPARTGPRQPLLSARDHRRRRRRRCVRGAQRRQEAPRAGNRAPDGHQQRDLPAQATPHLGFLHIHLRCVVNKVRRQK